MGFDPQTGMYTPDTSFQPTGALGAVQTLINGQRANDIANTLQQQRQAQADLESQQSQQYGLANQRQQAVRDAIGQLVQNNPNASVEDYRSAALGAGGDIAPWTSTFRSETAATGKENVARINALAGIYKTTKAGGGSDMDAMNAMSRFSSDPEELKSAIDAAQGNTQAQTPLPVPTAVAGLKNAQTKRIEAMTPAEIQLATSRSVLARAEAAYYGVRQTLASVKDPSDPAYRAAMARLNSIDSSVARLTATDKYGMNTQAQDEIKNLMAEKADVQKEVDRINAARAAKAGPQGAGTTGTVDPTKYTPFSGTSQTPQTGGATKTLVFPP